MDIGWNTSKIISWLISLKSSLTAGPKIDLFHREHPQILAGIGVRYGKSGSRRTKPAIYLKRLKIERKLLLTAYIKSYTGFRLPSEYMTSERDSRVCVSQFISIVFSVFSGLLGTLLVDLLNAGLSQFHTYKPLGFSEPGSSITLRPTCRDLLLIYSFAFKSHFPSLHFPNAYVTLNY